MRQSSKQGFERIQDLGEMLGTGGRGEMPMMSASLTV